MVVHDVPPKHQLREEELVGRRVSGVAISKILPSKEGTERFQRMSKMSNACHAS